MTRPVPRTRVIETRNLAVGYGPKVVLDHLNVHVDEGSFVSLLGPNGAGKTTFLRTLARLLPVIKGSVFIRGKELELYSASELARRLSVVLTNRVSPGLFTAFEFAALGRYPHTGFLGKLSDADRDVTRHCLKLVHAEDLAERRLDTLSDGERQKILVARALAQEPKIILLDEPTLHLDLKHRIELMAILQRLCRDEGISVVASLHDVDIAAKVSDQVGLIKGGTLIRWGAPEDVLQEDAVASLYDFNGASFNRRLGSIELKGGGGRQRVCVIAGMGSGAVLYRLLAKRGYVLSTGVLPSNDVDAYVAASLSAECVTNSPMEAISDEAFRKTKEHILEADFVIDAGFEVGSLNERNVELLRFAMEQNKPVYGRLPEGGVVPHRNGVSSRIPFYASEHELIEEVEAALARRRPEA